MVDKEEESRLQEGIRKTPITAKQIDKDKIIADKDKIILFLRNQLKLYKTKEPQKIKQIYVGSGTITIYRHALAKFVSGQYPECWTHLKGAITMLIGSREFRENAEENLKDIGTWIPSANFNKIVANYNKYRQVYGAIETYFQYITQFKHDNTLRAKEMMDFFEAHEQELIGKTPVVDVSLLILLYALTKGTPLENQQIPKELITQHKNVPSINLENNLHGIPY